MDIASELHSNDERPGGAGAKHEALDLEDDGESVSLSQEDDQTSKDIVANSSKEDDSLLDVASEINSPMRRMLDFENSSIA